MVDRTRSGSSATSVERPDSSHPASDEARYDAGVRALLPLLIRALQRDPIVKEHVREIVLRDIAVAVDSSELSLQESVDRRMNAMAGAVRKVAGTAMGGLHELSARIDGSVRFPRVFKAMVAAIVVLFAAVAWGSVALVRDAVARRELRGEMTGMVEEARAVGREQAAVRDDVGALQTDVRGLESRQSQDDALRSQVASDLSSFRIELENLGAALAATQLSIAELREDQDRDRSDVRRHQRGVEGRLAPVEAVTWHNPSRYQRSELDRMAGEQCRDEPNRTVRRQFTRWHVRSCTDGWNATTYQLWCAQEHSGQSPDMRFSGCTSTSPSWGS